VRHLIWPKDGGKGELEPIRPNLTCNIRLREIAGNATIEHVKETRHPQVSRRCPPEGVTSGNGTSPRSNSLRERPMGIGMVTYESDAVDLVDKGERALPRKGRAARERRSGTILDWR